MGGDLGPPIVIQGAIAALQSCPQLSLILLGDGAQIEHALQCAPKDVLQRISIQPTSDVVYMDDSPAYALRNKPLSSMRQALHCVASGKADACVSTGNTGALVGMARVELKTLPHIHRPVLMAALPKVAGATYVLDLGANIQPTAAELCQYARLGHLVLKEVDGYTAPSIGLLNIGEESIKGGDVLHQADAFLKQSDDLNYIGYVEGDAVYTGHCDLVICDGFSGNVLLKSSEGLVRMLGYYLETEFSRNILSRTAKYLTRPIWKRFYSHINPDRYNGASLLGLDGIVIKSHGKANSFAVKNAILRAVIEVDKRMIEKIKYNLLEQEGQ